ncbi:MAG: MgtC/SapB family protein [Candidatus Krumholzibacteria bacterium]|nr:MgtC/SapB family protein [Candidatus Krumholzibacteria bacterium]
MAEPVFVYLWRLLIALGIGAVVGLERELAGKPAGLRTNILMCVGSCLFMIISIEIARSTGGRADPGRIAAQVVTGVGFLCAGTIMRSRFTVSGLTTAATLWVLSALGLAVGAGYQLLAVTGAAVITVTLIVIRRVEAGIHRFHSDHIVQLVLDNRVGIVASALQIFTGMKIPTSVHDVAFRDGSWYVTVEYDTSRGNHDRLLKKISELEGVTSVTEIRSAF